MTKKQLEGMGLLDMGLGRFGWGSYNKYFSIKVEKYDDMETLWYKIHDAIFEEGVKEGERRKIEAIKKLLDI